MNQIPKPPRPTRGLSKPQKLSTLRLFAILIVFTVLASYAIWNSDRFQNLFQGVSQTRLSEALGVPVTFRRVEFRLFPPALRLADVRIENDPALTDPALRDRPLLTVEELSLGGGVSLAGRELRLGRVRAFRPHLFLVQLPDGTLSLPPGLRRKAKEGGLKVSVGEILAQQGTFEFDGRKVALDASLEDFTLSLERISGDRYRGSLASRRAVLDLDKAEPIALDRFETKFRIEGGRGMTFDAARFAGAFGEIEVSGAIEDFQNPKALFAIAGRISIEEVERVFHSNLGFAGTASLRGRLAIPPEGGFRLAGRVTSPRVDAQGFLLEDVVATVSARPEALVADIERARYAGGEASGAFRIEDLERRQAPMTLALEGSGLSMERFFADLDLPGTGLSGAADMTLAISWGESGIEHANGGGTIALRPVRAPSNVRGRFSLPIGGGGALSVADGRIAFEGTTFRFPESELSLTGGFRIGQWRPEMDFHLRSEDLTEVDRLFQNFVAATGGQPEPLGLGGSGEIRGHLAGTWANPDATALVSAEGARYANVAFGSVRGSVDIRDGAFFFRPLRVYDGEASLSLEGMAAFREVPGRPRLDLTATARAYPLARLLEYMDFDYPVEGLVTGTFPIRGDPSALAGGGQIELTNAVLWGQKFPRITGEVVFSPGRFAIEELRAPLGEGVLGGRVAFSIADKTFDARLAGDDIALSAITVLEIREEDLSGNLSFSLAASGSFERPTGTLTASISKATFFGHPVPEGQEPRLSAKVDRGVLEGSIAVPDRWVVTASGDLGGSPAQIQIALDVQDLANFLLFTPLDLPPGRGGALAINGTLTLPQGEAALPSGVFTMTRARLDMPDRPGVLASSGEVRFRLGDGRLVFDDFRLTGEGTELTVRGGLDLGEETTMNLSVSGPIDASLIALAVPDAGLSGRLRLDLTASGKLSTPTLSGTVRIEDGKYRLAGIAQILDEIDGSLRFTGSRGEIEGLRAKFGGGDVYAAGGFDYEGLSFRNFRVTLQARGVTLRYPADMRLLVDADLVATGDPQGNTLRGEVVLLRGTYSRDFEVSLADLLERTRPSTAVAAREPWKEDTRLEVRVVSSTGLEVRNNVARLTGAMDLLIRGTVADPTVLGQIVLDEGGRLTFRDVRYEVESGAITFTGRELFAPVVDVRARAEVRGYDLVVSLVGTWPRLQTSFSSDPPLPNDTIVALLLTGASPEGRAESETTGIVSAASGIVAGVATGVLTRQGQRLFRLDRFEIDPVFSGSQPTDLRTTVGKQITPNLSILYSQSLYDSSQEPIVRAEWRITDTIVLQGRRDENGVYLIDVRRRQRF